jgi:undecaprenyl diphosphate synthase
LSSPDNFPQHVGIIMDGNGRWAAERGKKRVDGHVEGLKVTKRIVKSASDAGIRFLSLYTFSTENWRRAQEEVSFLMNLLTENLRREYNFYRENKIRVVHSGYLEGLPARVQEEIAGVENDTRMFTGGLTVNLLINYGGRDEICRAVNKLIKNNFTEIDENILSRNLDQELPDVDLIIRTAGEQRLSNFMLWQASYAEYSFHRKLWPDFTENDFIEILENYSRRERRFGGYNNDR